MVIEVNTEYLGPVEIRRARMLAVRSKWGRLGLPYKYTETVMNYFPELDPNEIRLAWNGRNCPEHIVKSFETIIHETTKQPAQN